MNWIKLFVSQYQDIWSCPITNTNRNILPQRNRATSVCYCLKLTGLTEHIPMHALESFIRQWNHMIADCPTKNMHVHIYILCHGRHKACNQSEQRRLIWHVFEHLVTSLYVCAHARSACTPVSLSVWLTEDCVVAQGNSCLWGFLCKHVNKGEPPKSSPVCPPANENRAPSWAHPVDGEEGRDSTPWGKSSSKAQSFESGTGTDSWAITKTLPLWLNATSHCWARQSGCVFLTIWLLHH